MNPTSSGITGGHLQETHPSQNITSRMLAYNKLLSPFSHVCIMDLLGTFPKCSPFLLHCKLYFSCIHLMSPELKWILTLV